MKLSGKTMFAALVSFAAGAAALFCLIRFAGPPGLIKAAVSDYSELRSVNSENSDRSDLVSLAFDIAGYIKTGDYASLSQIVHPSLGLTFVPYSTVDFSMNKSFLPSEVSKFASDSTKYIWGTEDGTGNPIELTASEYFSKYVFDFDYTAAPVVGINKIMNSANALENVTEAFPNADFIELYNPGSGEYANGDWSALRLVFEEYDGTYRLTAIIHSVWTV